MPNTVDMLDGKPARLLRAAFTLGALALAAVALSACKQDPTAATGPSRGSAEARAIDLANVETAGRLIAEVCAPAAAAEGLTTLRATATTPAAAEVRDDAYPARAVAAESFVIYRADSFIPGADGARIQVQAAERPAGAAARFGFACSVVMKQAAYYPFEIDATLKARTDATGAAGFEAAAAALGVATSEPAFDFGDMSRPDSVRLPTHQFDVEAGRVTYYPAKAPGPHKTVASLVVSTISPR